MILKDATFTLLLVLDIKIILNFMFTDIFTAGRTNILWKLCVSFDTDQEHKIGVHIPNKSPELFLEDHKVILIQ